MHLGDGFYVDYDGYQISIAVNNHQNIVAYMDPIVLENFFLYVEKVHNCKIEIKRGKTEV